MRRRAGPVLHRHAAGGGQDGSVPAKPTGVVATATHDSVALAWDDPGDTSITHYQIFRRDRDVHDAGEFVTIKENTGSAATSYTDDTVEPETRYVYRVKAVNAHGASHWSDYRRANTPAAPDPADLAPSGLEVSLVENRVTLTWDAPASDAASVTGYEILRRRPNEGEAALTTLVADTGNAETGYTDDTANEPGVRYTYRVKALRDGEQSRVSNFARIDLPDDYAQDTPEPAPEPEEEPSAEALAPSGLTAEAAEDGGVALSWTAPAEDAGSVTGYEVLRPQGSAELATLEADTGSTDTAYTDETAIEAGETYAYQVKALRGEEKSQGSNRAEAFIPATTLTEPEPPIAALQSGVTVVPTDWSLIPSGLGVGDEFRLLFVSSTTRNAASTSISTYNTWIQNQAAAGHTDIQDYSDTFRVVGSTADVDARDNTYSTYTSSDKGVPIYWLSGNKVVDQYEDFYDGGWDDEANPTTEAGTSTSATNIWTGSDDDGTESFTSSGTSFALGKEFVALGILNHASLGPVGDSAFNGGKNGSRPFYGLSAVFRVVPPPPTVVPADWSLIPSGLVAGQEFRLLFLSSTKRSIRSTNISNYNTFVQNRAAAGHTDIQDYSGTFRVLGSTGAVDARDNTYTTYTSSDKGVRIYWLNGDKAADQYEDFYDGSWDQQADAWNESGVEYNLSARRYVATGSSKDGTTDQSNPLGASSGEVQLGCLYQTSSTNGPVWCNFVTENIGADDNQQLYGLSGVFQVTTNNATGKPAITGTPEVNQTLTADISGIMDEDGLPADDQFSYQWVRSDGTDDSDISGATDSTYLLKAADLGKTIKVRVTFTDEGGTEERLTSDATTAVAADTTEPVVEQVTCDDGACGLFFDELLDGNVNHRPRTNAFAVTADGAPITVGSIFPLSGGQLRLSSLAPQIRQGQTVKIVYTDPTSGDDTRAIQDEAGNDASSFTTGEGDVPAVTNNSTLAPVAPGAPTGLTATASGGTQIDLAWTAPADNGGDAITGYQIEYSDDAGTSWSVLVADTHSTDTMYSDTTLSGGDTRHYRVSAINSIGTGAASNSPPTGKPAITGTPEVKQTLTADISGIMDADGLPAHDQFSYQWVRNDGTDDSDISGATNATYKLKAADLGKTIKVEVTFTDEGGTEETLTSDATTAVAADTTGPVVEQVTCDDGVCGLFFDELLDGNVNHVPSTSAFAITADGVAITVGSVFPIGGIQIRLGSLAPQIYQGQTVIVTYTDRTAGNDANAIQDEAGHDAASFTTGEDGVPAVTNNSTLEPSTVTLVSNADRTIEGAISRTIQAQSFVTGPSTGGYMLSTIQIRLGDDSALPGVTDLIAAIKADDGSGEPGALVANLANPASLTNDALNTFTAPAGTVLAPDTTYWVVVNEERSDTDRVNLRVTAQDEEDDAFPGWSIGNNHLSKVSASGSWNHSATVSNLIVVSGSVIVGTPDTTGPVVEQVTCDNGVCGLFFDELLDGNVNHVPSTSAFAITADGVAITVGSVFPIGGIQIRLGSLAPQIYQGQTVIVTYTDRTAGNDANAIQDEAGPRRLVLHHRRGRRPRRHQQLHLGPHRTRRADGPDGDAQRGDANRPRLDRPGGQRRPRHQRLPDRVFRRRRDELERIGRRHPVRRHHVFGHHPFRRRNAALPGLGHQLHRHRRGLRGGDRADGDRAGDRRSRRLEPDTQRPRPGRPFPADIPLLSNAHRRGHGHRHLQHLGPGLGRQRPHGHPGPQLDLPGGRQHRRGRRP